MCVCVCVGVSAHEWVGSWVGGKDSLHVRGMDFVYSCIYSFFNTQCIFSIYVSRVYYACFYDNVCLKFLYL